MVYVHNLHVNVTSLHLATSTQTQHYTLYRVLYFTARTEGYFNPAKDISFAAISEFGKLGG